MQYRKMNVFKAVYFIGSEVDVVGANMHSSVKF